MTSRAEDARAPLARAGRPYARLLKGDGSAGRAGRPGGAHGEHQQPPGECAAPAPRPLGAAGGRGAQEELEEGAGLRPGRRARSGREGAGRPGPARCRGFRGRPPRPPPARAQRGAGRALPSVGLAPALPPPILLPPLASRGCCGPRGGGSALLLLPLALAGACELGDRCPGSSRQRQEAGPRPRSRPAASGGAPLPVPGTGHRRVSVGSPSPSRARAATLGEPPVYPVTDFFCSGKKRVGEAPRVAVECPFKQLFTFV